MQQHSVWKDCFLLLLVIGVVYFILMGAHPFLTPDEGRYVEIPREMLSSGQYLIPHLNGVPYFEKPPLFYWMQTFSLAVLGPSTWAMRAWIALMGVLTCVGTYLVTQKIWDRRTGLLAAVIQSTSFLYFGMSHAITLDSPLTFFLTLCLYSLVYGIWRLDHVGSGYKKWFYLAYVFSALAVMTKGLIGLVFPLLVVGLWIMLTRRWALLLRLQIIPGLIVLVAICFPWHYLAWQEYPEFFKFYFIDQQFARYATPIANRAMSKLSYIAILLLGLFPWIMFWVQSLIKVWTGRSEAEGSYLLFFALWGSAIFTFFFFSHSILVPYLLPIVAPFSVVLGRYFNSIWHQSLAIGLRMVFAGACIIFGLGFLLAPYFRVMGPQSIVLLHFATIALSFWALGLFAFMAGSKSGESFFKTVVIGCVGLYAAMILAMPYANTRSIKPLTNILLPLLEAHPNAGVVSFDEYYQDMTYYLSRTVTVAGWKNELSFGIQLAPATQQWMIDIPEFWMMWKNDALVYAIGPLWLYDQAKQQGSVCVLGQTIENVLVMNRSCGS